MPKLLTVALEPKLLTVAFSVLLSVGELGSQCLFSGHNRESPFLLKSLPTNPLCDFGTPQKLKKKQTPRTKVEQQKFVFGGKGGPVTHRNKEEQS